MRRGGPLWGGGARTLGVFFFFSAWVGALGFYVFVYGDGSTLVHGSLRRSFNACLLPFHDPLLSA